VSSIEENPDVGRLYCHPLLSGETGMDDQQGMADIEVLARMAARLAGRDPDEHLKLELGELTVFNDVMWRYPDFLARAETAYSFLKLV
jgi:hypothetical protein